MIKKVNVIVVYNETQTAVLMCLRTKDPYQGLYNFVGGKVEMGEGNDEAAYRELFEETGIGRDAITIAPLFTTQYYSDSLEFQVYYGVLTKPVTLIPEKHPLHWMPLAGEDFSSEEKFAGNGNIKHIIACANYELQAAKRFL